ncbi:MAG: disulfide oxidoreductase [Candidatus Muiribacterium halophilum]|uniref:Disulfide oxidoreductase n=1 Tax=Muiribacterium halophilum TaxID=2053465 RepID=A0A2N5ZAT4_MUIH1|nr:MAG: disulfide oxidoreductase [Candidatus Muirbacterium halophilum]
MIKKDTPIIEAAQNHPEIIPVFQKYGLGCLGCMAAQFETVEQGLNAHGISVEAFLKDANEAIEKTK